MRRRKRDGSDAAAAPAPPGGLRAHSLRLGSGSYVLLSFARDESDEACLGLTAAEQHVARELLAGLSNAEIARLRGCSPRTIANQVASLYAKLGTHSRAELAARFATALSPVVR
jgi:DNA-binding CsgD family transcriptional regulator